MEDATDTLPFVIVGTPVSDGTVTGVYGVTSPTSNTVPGPNATAPPNEGRG